MTLYNITNGYVGSFDEQTPDAVDVDKLVMGDKIGCYVDVAIEHDPPRREEVLMCYVASIQPDKKFKVYCNWGDRNDFHTVSLTGIKVRNAAFAKSIFPLLKDWEHIT